MMRKPMRQFLTVYLQVRMSLTMLQRRPCLHVVRWKVLQRESSVSWNSAAESPLAEVVKEVLVEFAQENSLVALFFKLFSSFPERL